MLVDAVYDNGHIIFNQPFHFEHKRFLLKVDLPDNEVIDTDLSVLADERCTYTGEAAEFRALTDALFGENYRYVPEKSDQEILIEELSKKYA